MPEKVRIVVTGTGWMGRGIGSVASALEALIRGARDEIQVAAYSISGGAPSFLEALEAAAARGIRVSILVNRFWSQPPDVQQRLLQLISRHHWCHLLDFSSQDPQEELHAKIIVADRASALIGSANLSRRGLLLNHELAVVLEGTNAAEVARALDVLVAERRLVREIHPGDSAPVSPTP